MSSGCICECCWELKRIEVPATAWMEWGEWLCASCASQAVEEHFADEDKQERLAAAAPAGDTSGQEQTRS